MCIRDRFHRDRYRGQRARGVRRAVLAPQEIAQVVVAGLEAPELEVVAERVATWPHGDAFRYDLEFWGLEPGDYDLRNFLRRKNGAPDAASTLPAIPVTVKSILPPGMVTPHSPGMGGVPALGGYRTV